MKIYLVAYDHGYPNGVHRSADGRFDRPVKAFATFEEARKYASKKKRKTSAMDAEWSVQEIEVE
jgi:hypothetical protein